MIKKFFNNIKFGSQKGVSMVELVLYMAILSVLLTILTSVFVSALDVQSESQATSSVEQDGNNNLILTDNSGPNNLNNYGSSVSGLSVQRLGNAGGVENTLKINFTVKSRTKRISGYETKNFQTNLSLRRQ